VIDGNHLKRIPTENFNSFAMELIGKRPSINNSIGKFGKCSVIIQIQLETVLISFIALGNVS